MVRFISFIICLFVYTQKNRYLLSEMHYNCMIKFSKHKAHANISDYKVIIDHHTLNPTNMHICS